MPNRRARRGHRALQRKNIERSVARCNGCSTKLLDLPTKTVANNPTGVERAIKAAVAGHRLKTGCNGVRPNTLANAIPDGPTMAECVCVGCGLIVITVPVAETRKKPEETQLAVTTALREHVAATGCTGARDPTKPPPPRRDPRCMQGVHVEECRCHREVAVLPVPEGAPIEEVEQSSDVFEIIVQR